MSRTLDARTSCARLPHIPPLAGGGCSEILPIRSGYLAPTGCSQQLFRKNRGTGKCRRGDRDGGSEVLRVFPEPLDTVFACAPLWNMQSRGALFFFLRIELEVTTLV